jgi:hypothetical protein
MATIGSLVLSLTAETATLNRDLARATRSIDTFASRAASAAKIVGVGFGVGGVAGLVAITQNAINAADAIGDLSKQLGVSTDALQSLQFAARQSGSSTEGLNAGLATFAKSVGQAQAGTGRLLSQLLKLDPVAAKQVQTAKDQEQALAAVADAIERADGAAAKSAISVAAFGDAGKTLVTTFADGADSIAAAHAEASRLGIILDTEVIAAAQQTNDELDKLSTVIGVKLVNSIGKAAVEFSKFTGLLGVNRVEGLKRELQAIEDQIKDIAATSGVRGNIADVLRGIGLGGLGETIEAGKAAQLNDLLSQRQAILNQLRLEAERVPPTYQHVAAATDDLADSTGTLAKAQRDLLTLFRSDAEADRRLRQMQTAHRQTQATTDELERQAKATAELVAAQQAAAERTLALIEEPYREPLPEARAATAEAFRRVFAT